MTARQSALSAEALRSEQEMIDLYQRLSSVHPARARWQVRAAMIAACVAAAWLLVSGALITWRTQRTDDLLTPLAVGPTAACCDSVSWGMCALAEDKGGETLYWYGTFSTQTHCYELAQWTGARAWAWQRVARSEHGQRVRHSLTMR